MTLTAGQVVEQARTHHPLFADVAVPDGSLLLALDTRQRTLLLRYGTSIQGLVSRSVDVATVIAGSLVGSASGVPVFGTTFEDGWATHKTAAGVPYWDFTEPAIAGDPFGQNGGTPGFPLPSDFVKLIDATVTYQDNRTGPIEIITESARHHRQRSPIPIAFLSGNRIVPVRALATGNSGDAWTASIVSFQLSYVALPVLTTLADPIVLPAVLLDALVANMAAFLAGQAQRMTMADRTYWATVARDAEQALNAESLDVAGEVTTTSVRYRG